MKNFSKIHGFTLLEMSIVMAIIGVLMGSIVVGKSLVRSSQLTTHINEGKLYLNAFGQFQMKYGYMPGDMDTASSIWPTAINGDANNMIYYSTGTLRPAEFFTVWQHLAFAELVSGTYTGVAGIQGPFQGIAGTNVPQGPINGQGYWFNTITTGDYATGVTGYFDGVYNTMLMAGIEQVANSMPNGSYLKPTEALKLDSKYDDGQPGMGWIRSPTTSLSPDCTAGTQTPAGAYYKTTVTINSCRLILSSQ